MRPLILVIGSKNYSSWSLRPWLAMKHAQLTFEEILIPLKQSQTKTEILKYSPTGQVPVLIDQAIKVWESLAICEYIADLCPQAKLWPDDIKARAIARAISCEMHAGFRSLRQELPMNLSRKRGSLALGDKATADIQRVFEIWRGCRYRFGNDGAFLFGHFTIADAMFAPVVARFMVYLVEADELCRAYMQAVWKLPAMQEWIEAAKQEPPFVL